MKKRKIERELACIIVAHDAIDQVLAKTTNIDDIDIYDRMIIEAQKKMGFLMSLYRGSRTMRNAAKIALNAYEREGKEKPNAMIFALSMINFSVEKSGLKTFPIAHVSALCDMFDAVRGYVYDPGVIASSADYAERIGARIYKSDAKHISDRILEAR